MSCRQRLPTSSASSSAPGEAANRPSTTARLAPADTTRVARALEVVRATGRPLAHWQAQRVGGIGDRIRLAAAMPCEFGLRTAEPVPERRVAEIFRRINQQAPADMRAIRRVIRRQGSRRRGAGGWALQRYAQGLAGGLNVDPVGKDDAASPAKFTRARP